MFDRLGVKLPADRIKMLQAHYELLLKWNRVLNLTRVESPDEAIDRHYGESLFLAERLPPGELRIADIGSGAGFPGLPVAVFRPDCFVTLIESHQRKAVFLREAARDLPNVRVVAKRAEQIDSVFDIAISRAVSYEDLCKCLKRLAPKADLLTGAEAPPDKLGLVWSDPIPLPWGKQRFLRTGSVSRETPTVLV
jgi:16S rRNA (guanine527-N7)-methyltransferase